MAPLQKLDVGFRRSSVLRLQCSLSSGRGSWEELGMGSSKCSVSLLVSAQGPRGCQWRTPGAPLRASPRRDLRTFRRPRFKRTCPFFTSK